MDVLKFSLKKNFGRWIFRHKAAALRKTELEERVPRQVSRLPEAAFDIFTDQGEDGIIYYLLIQMKDVPSYFVDIGAGDCIRSNCASLAKHYDWRGIFIDKSEKQLSIGKHYYKKEKTKGDIQFICANVRMDNINLLLARAGVKEDVGLLSVDIDGNDFWIWKAIGTIRPRLVVIEAKVEFGDKNLMVPYGPLNHHGSDKKYNGASVEAFRKLGKEKGYKLVGANKYGYNLFFVQESETIPEASTAEILADPETIRSFYPEQFFTDHAFEKA